jgi:hypothetical protein
MQEEWGYFVGWEEGSRLQSCCSVIKVTVVPLQASVVAAKQPVKIAAVAAAPDEKKQPNSPKQPQHMQKPVFETAVGM